MPLFFTFLIKVIHSGFLPFFLWWQSGLQVSSEDAKSVEIFKLQKVLESLNLELDAAKLATISECNKNSVQQNQLELSIKEKSALEKEFTLMAEMRKENALLKVCVLVLLNFFFND